MAKHSLRTSILGGDFYQPSESALLLQIHEELSAELEWLKTATSIKDLSAAAPATTQSLSQVLYEKDYDKINRTLVGFLALRWINADILAAGLKNNSDLYALVMSIVIKYLGKDPNLAKDYLAKTGDYIAGLNHDLILLRAAEVVMVPCLGRLIPAQKEDIMRALRLGAEFSFGQLAQGENLDGSAEAPAVQPTYMPAMFAQGFANTPTVVKTERWRLRSSVRVKRGGRVRGLQSLMWYVERVLEVRIAPEGLLTVIEQDLQQSKNVVQSLAFRNNPDVLDQETIPKDEMAKMAPVKGDSSANGKAKSSTKRG